MIDEDGERLRLRDGGASQFYCRRRTPTRRKRACRKSEGSVNEPVHGILVSIEDTLQSCFVVLFGGERELQESTTWYILLSLEGRADYRRRLLRTSSPLFAGRCACMHQVQQLPSVQPGGGASGAPSPPRDSGRKCAPGAHQMQPPDHMRNKSHNQRSRSVAALRSALALESTSLPLERIVGVGAVHVR